MRGSFVSALMEIAGKDKNVHLITGDLGFGVLKPFWEKFPEQFTNAGISEQNMIGVAAGMALEGKTVFVYSIGNFPTLRCIEQIRNDCAYHNANVKIVCVGGGFVYGALGMSHHATEDVAMMRALPGVTVMTPCDAAEAKAATKAVYEQKGTCYLRLGRGGEKSAHDCEINDFKIGSAFKIRDGRKIAVFSSGGIFEEAEKAVEILNLKGFSPALYTFPTVKPIDKNFIEKCALQYELIVTVEEHTVTGGFGSAVAEIVAELHHKNARVIRIGINDVYSSVVGSQAYLRDYYGISGEKIAERVIGALDE